MMSGLVLEYAFHGDLELILGKMKLPVFLEKKTKLDYQIALGIVDMHSLNVVQ